MSCIRRSSLFGFTIGDAACPELDPPSLSEPLADELRPELVAVLGDAQDVPVPREELVDAA